MLNLSHYGRKHPGVRPGTVNILKETSTELTPRTLRKQVRAPPVQSRGAMSGRSTAEGHRRWGRDDESLRARHGLLNRGIWGLGRLNPVDPGCLRSSIGRRAVGSGVARRGGRVCGPR